MKKLNLKLDSLKDYAPTIVRISMALVFLWFAINQLLNPKMWVGYLPDFLANMSNPVIFIYANATMEIILGTLLLLGIFTRISALILGLHLIGISITLGYNATAIRDLGLSLATLSIALHGSDKWCLRK